jgi:hypothetical protein
MVENLCTEDQTLKAKNKIQLRNLVSELKQKMEKVVKENRAMEKRINEGAFGTGLWDTRV